jgi:hypothetical protein
MNRIMKKDLRFGIGGPAGVQQNGAGPEDDSVTQRQRLWIYTYAETYNILRVYGGRASLLFAY